MDFRFEYCNVSILFFTKTRKRYLRRLPFAQIHPKAFSINENIRTLLGKMKFCLRIFQSAEALNVQDSQSEVILLYVDFERGPIPGNKSNVFEHQWCIRKFNALHPG